jgi:hypothetical protein
MTGLGKKILQDFYNQNNNPKIEVLLDYNHVYGRYFDRNTLLFEGEYITDGFVDMKTCLYFDKLSLDEEKIKAFTQNEFEVEIDTSLLYLFLEKDFQRIIDMNLKNGIDVKIVVCDFFFGMGEFYRLQTDMTAKSLLTTYKVERI